MLNRLNIELRSKNLTAKQSRITQLVTMGLSNAEVANQMFISERDVKIWLHLIYRKLNVKSRAQLIVYCLQHTPYVKAS